jgi:hypothetical protein
LTRTQAWLQNEFLAQFSGVTLVDALDEIEECASASPTCRQRCRSWAGSC